MNRQKFYIEEAQGTPVRGTPQSVALISAHSAEKLALAALSAMVIDVVVSLPNIAIASETYDSLQPLVFISCQQN